MQKKYKLINVTFLLYHGYNFLFGKENSYKESFKCFLEVHCTLFKHLSDYSRTAGNFINYSSVQNTDNNIPIMNHLWQTSKLPSPAFGHR
jgi:hypothetical protein